MTDPWPEGAVAGDPGAEVASLAAALLCDLVVSSQAVRDPLIAQELTQRLAAVGFRWQVVDGRVLAVCAVVPSGEAGGYTEAQLAALCEIAVHLKVAPAPEDGSTRWLLDDFHQRFSQPRGWSRAWVRRAVLGPLERDGYIRVVAPGQKRSESVIEAGMRLHTLDTRRLAAALERA